MVIQLRLWLQPRLLSNNFYTKYILSHPFRVAFLLYVKRKITRLIFHLLKPYPPCSKTFVVILTIWQAIAYLVITINSA